MAEPPAVLLAWLLGGYLLGSIPFGLLLVRAAGLGDIRRIGSGNIGATNVLRSGRRGLAAATVLLDAGKGALALLAARAWLGGEAALLVGLAALAGHLFPVWLRFKGGKGVATGAGLLFAAAWPVGLATVLVWLAAVAASRRSSVGAIAACLAAPPFAFALAGATMGGFAGLIGVVILLRHRANIARLAAGTEPRIGAR